MPVRVSSKRGRGKFPVAPRAARTVDGIVFDSAREARRYAELRLLQEAGAISHLQLQPSFTVNIEGRKLCQYTPDFSYNDNGRLVIEDVKSPGTAREPYYRLRKRAAELQYGIKVTEYIA